MCYDTLMSTGVYHTKLKNGTDSYRASLTEKGAHISLGSYDTEEAAATAYEEARELLSSSENDYSIDSINFKKFSLYFDKIVMLLNLRDNGMYIKTPIYLHKSFFNYYLTPDEILRFDNDDLFYYSTHKIMRRQGHLFVSDYGMQVSIMQRYGVKPFAVAGRDFEYVNGDKYDMSYANIRVLSHYHGVYPEKTEFSEKFITKIHLNGDYIVGRFSSEAKAAVAYNKAVDLCRSHGFTKNFPLNYVTEYTPSQYADVYSGIKISKNLINFIEKESI